MSSQCTEGSGKIRAVHVKINAAALDNLPCGFGSEDSLATLRIQQESSDQCGFHRLDAETWSLIYALKKDHIVHFIKNSKENIERAYHKFGSSICYGLPWESL